MTSAYPHFQLLKRDLKHIRLVCKTLSRLAEPLVFDSLVISFLGNKKVAIMGDMLSAIALKTSPFVHWATRLRIHSLLPVDSDGSYWDLCNTQPLISDEAYNITQAMLPLQSQLLMIEYPREKCVVHHP